MPSFCCVVLAAAPPCCLDTGAAGKPLLESLLRLLTASCCLALCSTTDMHTCPTFVPVALQGIATLALESPYYGERKPHYQQGEEGAQLAVAQCCWERASCVASAGDVAPPCMSQPVALCSNWPCLQAPSCCTRLDPLLLPRGAVFQTKLHAATLHLQAPSCCTCRTCCCWGGQPLRSRCCCCTGWATQATSAWVSVVLGVLLRAKRGPSLAALHVPALCLSRSVRLCSRHQPKSSLSPCWCRHVRAEHGRRARQHGGIAVPGAGGAHTTAVPSLRRRRLLLRGAVPCHRLVAGGRTLFAALVLPVGACRHSCTHTNSRRVCSACLWGQGAVLRISG